MADSKETLEKDNPGVIAPPPLIFGGIFLIALVLDWAVSGLDFNWPYSSRIITGLILCAIGLGLILVAAIQFRRAKTELEPWKPATSLVTGNIYRLSRNPIYIGMALVYVGLSLLTDSVLALLALPLALAIIHYGVIKREEHYLEVKFGQDYRDYTSRTRRWI